jgi:outer membrane protein TolC
MISGLLYLTANLSAGINLHDLWQLTIKNNYSLMQQNKLLERAEKEVDIQKTGYLPKVSASAYGAWLFFQNPPNIFQDTKKDVTVNILSLGIDQPVFTGFRTKNIIDFAEHNLTAQALQKDITKNTLYLETGNLFYDIQSNLVQQQVLTESINRINSQLTKIRNLRAAQQATAFDTLELANKKLQIITQLAALDGQSEILTSGLKYLVNDQSLPEINKPGNIAIDLNLDQISAYYQLARSNRPELRQLSARMLGQSSFTQALKAAYYPRISASGAYNRARLDGLIFDGSWIDLYSVFVTFQWEIWAWNRDKRKVQQARLEVERLDIASQELVNNIEQQVKTAYQMLEITRKQIYLKDQLVQQEQERFRQTRERQQQGLTTMLDLNSAENDLTTAQLELEKTKILWHKNKLQLDFATGIIGNNLEEK